MSSPVGEDAQAAAAVEQTPVDQDEDVIMGGAAALNNKRASPVDAQAEKEPLFQSADRADAAKAAEERPLNKSPFGNIYSANKIDQTTPQKAAKELEAAASALDEVPLDERLRSKNHDARISAYKEIGEKFAECEDEWDYHLEDRRNSRGEQDPYPQLKRIVDEFGIFDQVGTITLPVELSSYLGCVSAYLEVYRFDEVEVRSLQQNLLFFLNSLMEHKLIDKPLVN